MNMFFSDGNKLLKTTSERINLKYGGCYDKELAV